MRNVFWLRGGVIGGRSGPNRDAWSPRDLATGGIGAVLSVNDGELVRVSELAEVGIDYCCVPLSDAAPPLPEDLELCVNALPCALSFALRSIEHQDPSDAIREVRRVRPIALSAKRWEEF